MPFCYKGTLTVVAYLDFSIRCRPNEYF